MAQRILGQPYIGTIQTRIRPGKDDDLARELGDLPLGTDISDVTRTALRFWFGLINKSQVAVIDGPEDVFRTPETLREHSGNTPGTLREHSGNIQGISRPEKPVTGPLELDTSDLVLVSQEPSDDDLESNLDDILSLYK